MPTTEGSLGTLARRVLPAGGFGNIASDIRRGRACRNG